MALYRNVHVSFWDDPFVLELTPEEKYFFLYLMTNPKTTQLGIYEIPKSRIQFETGYNRDTVEKLLNKFIDYDKILCDDNSNEIMLINWLKYNYSNSPKVIKCIEKEFKKVKSSALKNEFHTLCKEYQYSINTLSQEEEEKEEEKKEEKEQLINEFERFWNLYDKKVGRGDCFDIWKKLSAMDKGKIFESLPNYISASNNKQYRLHPAKYLKNQSWLDEIYNNDNKTLITTLSKPQMQEHIKDMSVIEIQKLQSKYNFNNATQTYTLK